MASARVNAGFEMVSAMRLAHVAAAKRTLDQAASIDDRRKLAVAVGHVSEKGGAKRYFTPSEVGELAGVLQDLATSNAEIGVALAMAAQEYVHPDHRGFGFWDYFAINLYKCERSADAYLVWQRAVNPQPSDDKQELKKEPETKPAAELPLRPRVRARGGDKKEESTTTVSTTNTTTPDSSENKPSIEVFSKSDHHNLGHIRNNMNFALQKLKCGPVVKSLNPEDQLPTADKLFDIKHKTRWNSLSIPARFHAFNPSIITHPTDSSKFLVNLRAGNYFMNDKHKYEFPAGMTGITTLNFLGTIESTFRGEEFGETKQLKAPPMPNPFPDIAGLEDIRLLYEPMSRKLYASFTSLEVTPEHRPQVALMQIDYRKGRIVGNPVRLHGYESDRAQKNWIGFADSGKLYFIYSLQPITVVQANPKTGEVRVVSVDSCPVINEWRGSSTLVELNEHFISKLPMVNAGSTNNPGVRWFIALVHISHFPKYHHQFIVLKKTPVLNSEFRPFSFQVTHQSPPFVFEKHDVEFSCGMAFTPDNLEIVVPYSKRDNDCTCIRISTQSLFADNLYPIPNIHSFKLNH